LNKYALRILGGARPAHPPLNPPLIRNISAQNLSKINAIKLLTSLLLKL